MIDCTMTPAVTMSRGLSLGESAQLHPDPGASHAAMVQQVVDDPSRAIDRDGEAQPDRSAAGRVDRRVDADHLAHRIDERPPGVARVDRGVGLDHPEIDAVPLGAAQQIASRRAHHPSGHARLGVAEHEAERIPDGDDPLADEELFRRA
jgi:hypothetical protein